jgi:hypothetical protein
MREQYLISCDDECRPEKPTRLLTLQQNYDLARKDVIITHHKSSALMSSMIDRNIFRLNFGGEFEGLFSNMNDSNTTVRSNGV